jgi:CRISPR/Cas system CSM-associated protein Csm2 small subunit
MNKLAYENLKLLDEVYSDSLFLISDNDILSLIEKDSFDTCSKIQSLEYPIFFTYHHILNIVDYDKDISYKNKMKLLTMIENSLNNLINYLDDYEENQSESKITNMLDDIYERLDIVKNNHKHNYLEKFIYLFDDIVDYFRTAEKYLYFSPMSYYPLMNIKPGDFVDDGGETENESDSESSESDDESSSSESEDESDNETVSNDNELKID